jgi:hypothetical protein
MASMPRFPLVGACLAVVLLGAVTTAHAKPPRPEAPPRALVLRGPDQAVPLAATLTVELRTQQGTMVRVEEPLVFRPRDDAWLATVRSPRIAAKVRLHVDGDAVAVDVELEHREKVEVEREVLRLVLPGEARIVERDLSFTALGAGTSRVDRGTPIVARVGSVLLTGGAGVVAAIYQKTPSTRSTQVDLVLDDVHAHPFATYASCPSGGAERVPRARITRRKGERLTGQARLYLLDPTEQVPATPLIVERWPAGSRAAVVFTDHADRTDPDALRAVLYGSSDPTAASYGKRGLLVHGLRLTRSFFLSRQLGALDNRAIEPLVEALLAGGSELAAHSVTPQTDTREAVAQAVTPLRQHGITTWIDHEPVNNCEALSNQGVVGDPRYRIADLLVDAGVRWVWTADHVSSSELAADEFEPGKGVAAPAFYPLPADPRLWVFSAAWFFARPERLEAALSDKALDKLGRERGLFVAHTYHAPGPAPAQRRPGRAPSLPRDRARPRGAVRAPGPTRARGRPREPDLARGRRPPARRR